MLNLNKCTTRAQQLPRWATIWPQQIWAKKWGLLCQFPWEDLDPHLTQCWLGRGLPPYHVASWCIQPFSHNRHGPKSGGGCCAPLGRAGSPSNTMWPGLRPTSMPSGILIHSAVWPQQTWTKKCGGCCALLEGAGSPCNTMSPGPSLPPYQAASWSMQPFGHNRHGPKIGGLCPFWGEMGMGTHLPSKGRRLVPI